MHNREKHSIEARMATVRLGLLAISSLVIAALIGITLALYSAVSPANDAPDVDYSFGDYMGDVGPVMIPILVIIIVAALALYFGYGMYLKNSEGESGE